MLISASLRKLIHMYLHERKDWTHFTWDTAEIAPLVSHVRFQQGKLLGTMSNIGFELGLLAEVQTVSQEVLASSRIEGVELDAEKVRSSVSRQLGIEDAGLTAAGSDTRDVDGAVQVTMDAALNHDSPLTHERLFGWHAALFPTGYSGLRKITVGAYRQGPMSVVSGPIGKEHVHYQAPEASDVPALMDAFLDWANSDQGDDLLKAGIAHLWFLTIHPFDDGNGRLARALTELFLCRSDGSPRRFYSAGGHILTHRDEYYAAIERAQRGTRDITDWLRWFLNAIEGAIELSKVELDEVFKRSAFWTSIENVSLNERQKKMLALFVGDFKGKLTAQKWAKICKVSPDTALRDINDLIGKGILNKEEAGGRSTSYVLTADV